MSASHATTLLVLLFCKLGFSQTYYGVSHHQPPASSGFWNGHTELHKITINNGTCTEQNIGIVLGAPNDSVHVEHFCHCPDGFLYGDVWNDSTHFYKINPQTAQVVGVIPMTPPQGNLSGMVCKLNGMIQALATKSTGTKFVEINPATGALTVLSSSNEVMYFGDLVQYDSVWYVMDYPGIRRMDFVGNTFSSELLYDPSPALMVQI